jgi:hypothetical protein
VLSNPTGVRSGFIVANTPTLNQHAQENYPSTSLIHRTSPASIPMAAYQSQHLRLPARADDHLAPSSQVNTIWVASHQDALIGPIRQQPTGQKRRQALERVYDKPGKKAAVECEPTLPRLQELSKQRGGQDFAIAWIPKAFMKGVTVDALNRTLSEEESNTVDHDHGFRLSQAYDGFLEKVEDRFSCGLCPQEKRANWKHKKDAIRHFQKFHFGIGEICGSW